MPMTVPTYPLNIWTRGEFDKWIAAEVRAELEFIRSDQIAPTEEQIEQLQMHITSQINWSVVPAGNA